MIRDTGWPMPFFRKSDASNDEPSELDKELAQAFAAMGTRDADAPVEAGLAKETLIAMMFRHADMLAATTQARESATLYELASNLAGVDSKSLTEGKNIDDLRALGTMLMSAGRLQLATKVFEELVTLGDKDHDVHTRLSALYYAAGDADKARQFLLSFFKDHPMYEEAASGTGRPKGSILLLNGFSKTNYKVNPSGHGNYKHYRSGGHFMLRYLLDNENYNIHGYVIADSNIDHTPPKTTCDILLNTIADADTEYQSLRTLENYLARTPHSRVINNPSNVLKTTRDGNFERLNAIPGIRFPQTKRFDRENLLPNELAKQIEDAGFSYPLIIRRTGTHTAVSTELVEDRQALEQYLESTPGECFYAIEFVENKSAAGHYTKMRFFAIDGELYPVVRHMDQVWNVHGGNRKTFMAGYDWMLKKEETFMNNPASVIGEEAYALLKTLPDLIGLEFFGFDFTLLENGDVLIFELNPAMRHSFTHAETFKYLEPHMQAVSDAFAAMVAKRAAAAHA